MNNFECLAEEFGEPLEICEPGNNLYSGIVGSSICKNVRDKFVWGKIQHRDYCSRISVREDENNCILN